MIILLIIALLASGMAYTSQAQILVHGLAPVPNAWSMPNFGGTNLMWFGTGDVNVYQPFVRPQIAWIGTMGVGSTRSDFRGPTASTNDPVVAATNNSTFAWSVIESQSNVWCWGSADAEMSVLFSNYQVIVCFFQGPWITNGCPNGGTCNVNCDPSWTSGLSTAAYVSARAQFINAFANRYSSNQWKYVTGAGVTNGLHGIEPMNEEEAYGYGFLTNEYIPLLQQLQPSRTNGVQIIGFTDPGPDTNNLALLVSAGMLTNVDAISWHAYIYPGSDASISMYAPPFPVDTWYTAREDQYMNYLYTAGGIPSNMPIYVTEVGTEWIGLTNLVEAEAMAKEIVELRWGGAASVDFNPSGGPFYNVSDFPPYRFWPSDTFQAVEWAAYWMGTNAPIGSVISNGVCLGFTFGAGSSKVILAWTQLGTGQAIYPSNFTAIVNLFNQPIQTTNLTQAVTVFRGNGTINF